MIQPILDHNFIPAVYFNRDFLSKATRPFSIAVEREDGLVYRRDTKLGEDFNENCRYAERLIKTILWCAGGWKVMLSGDHAVYEYIRDAYTKDGLRAFDVDFWSTTYERPFEVEERAIEDMPENKARPLPIGRNLGGCRVGFDAGGSDMKVAAVVNGETVWAEEIVWLPKLAEDISYHHEHIKNAILKAAEHMPSFDAVGVSTAGVLVANRAMVSHLFLKVPKDTQGEACKNVYVDVLEELGVPYSVANDGDVAALAASMAMDVNGVLGIAMGTSEAGGYIDPEGHVTGWHNELAFVPVDYNPEAPVDEWSGDYGCGVKYFSQDAVIRLAPKAGITLDENLTLAEKLKAVQAILESGDEGAKDIFRTIGTYFGYAIANYADFYDIQYLQISGRVTSGLGGDLIIEKAKEVLEKEFPALFAKIQFILPDEMDRRVGQAVAAASLPAAK